MAKVFLPEEAIVFIFGSQANLKEIKKADFDIGLLEKERIDYKTLIL